MLYPYVLMMEFRLFSVQFMCHVTNMIFMIDTDILEPCIEATHDGGLSKEVVCDEG